MDDRDVGDEQLVRMQAQLSPDEEQRFFRFQRQERRRQYLLGRMLLRHATSCVTGVHSAAIRTIERPGLGPLLVLPEGVQHPDFSLSHSRHWIACALGFGGALGLDIEAIDQRRDVIALSEAGFHPDEHAWLLGQTDAERVTAFYRLWTLKEALFKLMSNSGRETDMPALIGPDGERLSHGDGWFSASVEHPDLSITLCGTCLLPDINWIAPLELVF